VRRGGVVALLLLAGGAFAILLVLSGSLRERLAQEHRTNATLALRSLAASVARAHDLGIPLQNIVGLDELARSRASADGGIAALRLLDSRGRVLWRDPERRTSSALLEVPIGTAGRLQAEFIPPNDTGLFVRLAVMLLAVAAALALPLFELARLSDLVREDFSSRYFQRQLDAVRRGDLRTVWQTLGVIIDTRLQFLHDRLYLLNEQYQRVVRLVGSLRRTEPDAGRRARMSALLETLAERFRFSAYAAPLDRRVWPAADTARCFAMLTLMLANLSLGGGGSSPYDSPAARYSALVALAAWSGGLLAGAVMRLPWAWRLRAGIAAAALTNVLMIVGEGWSNACAHALGGLATSLAACAAMETGRAHPRRTLAAMVLAASVAGPVLGLAMIAVLGSLVTAAWLYGGAALVAVLCAAWLSYRLFEPPAPSPGQWAGRLVPLAVLAGAAWSAAFLAFVAQSSANREQALRLMAVQIPGLLALAFAGARQRTALATALALIGILRLGSFALPRLAIGCLSPDILAWAGAACLAGALATPRNCRGTPAETVAGGAIGILVTFGATAVAGWASPRAVGPVALGVMLLALATAFALSRMQPARSR
jgi:hypothetical protein